MGWLINPLPLKSVWKICPAVPVLPTMVGLESGL